MAYMGDTPSLIDRVLIETAQAAYGTDGRSRDAPEQTPEGTNSATAAGDAVIDLTTASIDLNPAAIRPGGRRASPPLDENGQVKLIETCIAEQAEFRKGNTTNFWKTVSAAISHQLGVPYSHGTCKTTADRLVLNWKEQLKDATGREDNNMSNLNQALLTWMEFLAAYKAAEEAATESVADARKRKAYSNRVREELFVTRQFKRRTGVSEAITSPEGVSEGSRTPRTPSTPSVIDARSETPLEGETTDNNSLLSVPRPQLVVPVERLVPEGAEMEEMLKYLREEAQREKDALREVLEGLEDRRAAEMRSLEANRAAEMKLLSESMVKSMADSIGAVLERFWPA